MKLLILADDFTGALDTGVQLAAQGISTLFASWGMPFPHIDAAGAVTLDLSTRHLPPAEAFRRVFETAACFAAAGGGMCVYKKTDSCLRGNIGAELEAALRASGAQRLHFIPAWPSEGRVTKNGIHYVSSVPVSESPFGRDALNPVPTSDVAKLISLQSGVPVRVAHAPITSGEGICVYNCGSEDELAALCRGLARAGELRAAAGCAGFARHIGAYAAPVDVEPPELPKAGKLLILSGSINAVSAGQIKQAESMGVPCLAFSKEQRRIAPGVDTKLIYDVRKALERSFAVVLSSGADAPDCPPEAMAQAMGTVADALLDKCMALAVFGGDTLACVTQALGIHRISPAAETEPGVAVSIAIGRTGPFTLFTKSGGLGSVDVVSNIIGFCRKTLDKIHNFG